jgi:putative DNA methylase
MLNQTRAHPGIARESKFQGPGIRPLASDLNPLAVLICKALIEFPPKFADRKPVNPEVNELHQYKGARGLAEDVRYYGRWMREQAGKKIGHLYPKVKLKDGTEATVVAWLWARTVPSPDPRAKGAHVPLASSFVLSAKPGKEVIAKPVVDRTKMKWTFQIDERPSKPEVNVARNGTKDGNGFRCLLTGTPMTFSELRAYGKSNRFGARLIAIVADGRARRMYCAPSADHEELALGVRAEWRPEQALEGRALGFRVPEYGLSTWGDLFTERQLVALTILSDLVLETRERVLHDAIRHFGADDKRALAEDGNGAEAYADAVATYLGLALDRVADWNNTCSRWENKVEVPQQLFGRQTVSMVWDFAEANPIGAATGSLIATLENMTRAMSALPQENIQVGKVWQADAASSWAGINGAIIATDPPYYDNIGYADLSDFFYVWLRRTLGRLHPELFRRVLTPKSDELVVTPFRHGGKDQAEQFFLEGMRKAMMNVAQNTGTGPASIYYAFKQSENAEDGVTSSGWASFLQAVVDSGLAVDGTWPMRSELANRMRGQNSNAPASSIILICRHREGQAPTITRADFLRVLRREMPAALAEIRRAGVGPTDIQQAAIGPGMGIFTRHAEVLNTDGTPMLVKDALKLINQVREEITTPATGEYDAETLFALDWFAAKGFEKGQSGDAIVMTNAVDISLDGMNEAGFFLADGGVARLLKREELPDDWDPTKDGAPTVWEACQHLIKRLRAENGGIDAAAALYNRLGGRAEPARTLARRLYDICEQNQWAAEGYVYNQLHQEWDAIEKRAAVLVEGGQARDLFTR